MNFLSPQKKGLIHSFGNDIFKRNKQLFFFFNYEHNLRVTYYQGQKDWSPYEEISQNNLKNLFQ